MPLISSPQTITEIRRFGEKSIRHDVEGNRGELRALYMNLLRVTEDKDEKFLVSAVSVVILHESKSEAYDSQATRPFPAVSYTKHYINCLIDQLQ